MDIVCVKRRKAGAWWCCPGLVLKMVEGLTARCNSTWMPKCLCNVCGLWISAFHLTQLLPSWFKGESTRWCRLVGWCYVQSIPSGLDFLFIDIFFFLKCVTRFNMMLWDQWSYLCFWLWTSLDVFHFGSCFRQWLAPLPVTCRSGIVFHGYWLIYVLIWL